jgi:hypothetical protein
MLHFSKYKLFYALMLIAGILVCARAFFQSTKTISNHLSYAFLYLILCVICMGLISIGATKNNFKHNEHRLFWKKVILLMSLVSLYPTIMYVYYFLTSGNSAVFELFPPVLMVVLLIFIGTCLTGMLVNSLVSFVAGIFLLASHLVIRLWYRIHRSKSPAFLLDAKTDTETSVSKSFIYYVFEFFLFSLWFVILISSVVSPPIEYLWEIVWDTNLILVIVPLSAIVCLLLLYESLKVGWKAEGETKGIISPRLLYKFWSVFAVVVFVAKLLWEGMHPSIIEDLCILSFYLLIISSGFAIGFVGTSRIGMTRASKEIRRMAKRYQEIKIHQ